jgi:hypothetical protein
VAGGATEHGKVTYVPSRNKNADSFEKRGGKFRVIKNIFLNKSLE